MSDRLRALPRFELLRIDSEDDGRRYATPDGTYHSVTAILSGTRDQTGLQQWRESIGPEKADEIRDMASFRGTKLHEAVENYLLHGEIPAFNFLVSPYWNSIRPFVERVDEMLITEAMVWHPSGYAGTLDCLAYLAEDDAQPTLCDWKTADKPCKPDKLYEYSLQLAAYRDAANYVYRSHGLRVDRAVIAVAIPDEKHQLHELDKDALDQLSRHFQARIQRFTRARR